MSRRLVSLPDQIRIAAASPFKEVATPITYATWVKSPILPGGNYYFMCRENVYGSGVGQFLYLKRNAVGSGYVDRAAISVNQPGQAIGTLPDLTDSEGWVFLVFDCDDPVTRVFAGTLTQAVVQVDSGYVPVAAMDDVSSAPLILGDTFETNTFLGRIAHFSVWSGLLTLAEMDHLRRFPWAPYARCAGASLLGYWPLLSADPAAARDYSGYNNHGAFVGGVVRDADPAFDLTGNVLG